MRKSLLSLLLLMFGLVAMVPSSARAATLYGGDYVAIAVPDLAQAVAFFQDVLDCRLIGPVTNPPPHEPPKSRLLSCNAGSIVELFDERTASSSAVRLLRAKAGQPLQFVTDDVVHAGEWLRHEHVSVHGAPHRLTSGSQAGRMVLDFKAPWGLRLQLLGNSSATSPEDDMLATVGTPLGGG